MRLAFAGTPEVAVPSLRALLDSTHEVVSVITQPAKPSGRGQQVHQSPVADAATEAGVPVLAPRSANDADFLQSLKDLEVDCCAVVAYGNLLRPAALQIPPYGWVNLHFSLLPAWRGAAPVQHSIMAGDDITGASTFRIQEGLDDGPVFGVVTERIAPTDTAGELLDRLARSGAGLLVATIDGIADGTLVPRPQGADGVSMAPKISVHDAQVRWADPAVQVDRRIRACTPTPGAWTTFRGERVKVGPVRPIAVAELAPGEIAAGKHEVRVGTATSDVLLGFVQVHGKRPMPAADWARGARPGGNEGFG